MIDTSKADEDVAKGEFDWAEAALRRSEARYRTLFNSLDAGFCVVEVLLDGASRVIDYRFLEVNVAFERQTGLSGAVGRTMKELVPDHETHWFDIYGEIALTGKPAHFENRANGLGGRWYEVSAFRIGEPDERQVGILFSDVTVRHRAQEAERELTQALERRVAMRTAELQEVVRELEAFNYSVSHDLRSPLRTVAGMASILLEDAGPALRPEHRDLLERQSSAVRRMASLIDELLRLSRLSRADLHRMPIDVTAKAREAAESEENAHPGDAKVEIQEGMRAEADPNLVRILLKDLIGNAMKFSPNGGTIRIWKSGGVFSVADEGIGFDMAYASRIFLPFERLVRESDYPGAGVGLASAERIVRRHGGRLWADSVPGRGAVFSFTLPGPSDDLPEPA